MTYGILDLFSQIFRTTSDEYYLGEEKITGHIPTASDYNSHLSGKSELVIIPKNRIGFVIGKAIAYKPHKIESSLVTIKSELHKCYYVALFFKESLPPDDAYRVLTNICKYYQIGIVRREQFELPLFGSNGGNYKILNDNEEEFSYIDDILDFLRRKQCTVDEVNKWESNLLFNDAPPCIQTKYLIDGDINCNSFYNGKVYLFAKGEQVETEGNVYNCKHCEYCNKLECTKRKYSPESQYISTVNFGKLTQYRDNPVFYKWELNGKEIRFDSELDIMRQDRFITICFRNLNILPNRVTDNTWNKIVQRALKGISVVGEETIKKSSTETLKHVLVNTLKKRTLVSPFFEYERFMQGYMYLNPANLTLNVNPESLSVYLSSNKDFGFLEDVNDLLVLLKHLGFRNKRKHINEVRCTVWYLRTEFLFDDREDWKKYLLSVSDGTMWEENFKAFLLDENDGNNDEISEEDMAAIESDADVYLDTQGDYNDGNRNY